MKACHRGCLHRHLVENYYDARDARDALRESSHFMQHEADDFDREVPKVLFKEWLIANRRAATSSDEAVPSEG